MKITIIFLSVFLSVSYAANAEQFNLRISNFSAFIQTSQYSVTLTSSMSFKVKTPKGEVVFSHRNCGKAASLRVTKNDRSIKRVEVISERFDWGNFKNLSFYLNLEVRKDLACIMVESGIKNHGEKFANGYYFWRMSPACSEFYVTSKGDFEMTPGPVKFKDWLFLPYEDGTCGHAFVMNTEQENITVSTLFPQKDWQQSGWYITQKKIIGKDEINSINFIFMLAKDENETKTLYHKINAENLFPSKN